MQRPPTIYTSGTGSLPPISPHGLGSRTTSQVDSVSLSSYPKTRSVGNMHVSQSHTNLLLMDNASEFSELVDFENVTTPTRPPKRPQLSMHIDPSLIAVLASATGTQLDLVEFELQAIKASLDDCCSKYTSDWDKFLGDQAKSLFHSLGGWKSIILKIHQIFANILLPIKSQESSIYAKSNAWETTSLLSHIARMKINAKHVQVALNRVHNTESEIPVIKIQFSPQSVLENKSIPKTFAIDLQIIWYAVQCCGRFDLYLEAMIASQIESVLGISGPVVHSQSLGKSIETAKQFAKRGQEIYKAAQFRHRLFSEQYEWYMLMLSQQGSQEGIEATLKDIETDLLYSNYNPSDSAARKRIERLLVQMVGHPVEAIRSTAVKLMNQFYDTHDWQSTEPFSNIKILTAGDELTIEWPNQINWDNYVTLSLELIAPSISPEVHSMESFTRWNIHKGMNHLNFGNLSRCGFYDWRISGLSSNSDDWEHMNIQGRIIVHPRNCRDLQICSALVDEVVVAEEERGTFATVTSHLIDKVCGEIGINAVCVRGAAARDNGPEFERPTANPYAVTDRASPCDFLGGRNGFTELTSVARRNGVHTLVDVSCRVSTTHKHRKYRDHQLYVLDLNGIKRLMDEHDSSCLLNYRSVDAWDLLVDDIRAWPSEFGTSGVFLNEVENWPPILPIDKAELLRVDPDGELHYSSNEIMAGSVCRPRPEPGEVVPSFWNTEACDQGWPNPMLIKLVKEIWREFPGFFFMAQIDAADQCIDTIIRSGVIPIETGLMRNVAPMYGKFLDPQSGVTREGESTSSLLVENFLRKNICSRSGSIMGVSSTFKSSPPVAQILGRGRAPFADLFFSLPSIPCMHYGEYECMMEFLSLKDHDIVTEQASTPPLPSEHVMHAFSPLIVPPSPEPQSDDPHNRSSSPFIEMDPSNCIAHYSLLSKTRRRKGGEIFSSLGKCHIVSTSEPQVICLIRSSSNRHVVIVINFGNNDSMVTVDLSQLASTKDQFMIETDFLEPISGRISIPWSSSELASVKYQIPVPRFSSIYRSFKILRDKGQREKFMTKLAVASIQRFGPYIQNLVCESVRGNDCHALASLINQLVVGGISEKEIFAKLLETVSKEERVQVAEMIGAKISKMALSGKNNIASKILAASILGPIMFTTPELGKWSTFGGLGVMVDDLINTLSVIRESSNDAPTVWVCSPYYERNRRGESGYLSKDNINWSFNIEVDIGIERVTVGVYEKIFNGIRYFFLHNGKYFPSIYPDYQPHMMTAFLALMAKCPLEICCRIGVIPSTIVTNDWATGLTAAYGKNGQFFGNVFSGTKFLHIVHNLDQNYEGRLFPSKHEDVAHIHMLPKDLLVDPHWQRFCVNPSRCAILASDNWGTVSVSYRKELLEGSPLAPILRMHPTPFAHPNGIPLEVRLARINALNCASHWEAKQALQRKYFPQSDPSKSTVLIGFIGRITFQKGIHLILDIAEQLLRRHAGQVQVIVGGMVNPGESYASHCADRMRDLNRRFPNGFWSDPDAFFVDGSLLNYGADYGLMPSAFEPGGIVQQEFLVAGTPVIAFKTGGLKDTISEYYNGEGNGFTFEAHTAGDLAYAVERALRLFWQDRKSYDRLRENSKKSVVTCDMVAKAWLGEFHRMHGKVYFDSGKVRQLMSSIHEYSGANEIGSTETMGEMTDEELSSSSEDWVGGDRSVAVSTPKVSHEMMRRDPSVVGIVRRTVRIIYRPTLSVDIPRSVLLAGSFDQWASRIPLRWDKSARSFFVDIRVPQGKWAFKLIVDGSWTCIDDYPTEKDSDGNVNNVILVD